MPPLPRVTAIETLRAVQRDGWQIARQTGSHAQLTHPGKPGRVTIPLHSRRTLGPKVLRSILSQAGLSVDRFRDLL
jgi:predicted RNA binding protein YcfA (HicA-like mRNA interferase family)